MAHRTFADRNGATWEVWDVRPDTKPGREALSGVPAEGWLCFQSGEMRRRLMPIPPGWERVPEDQLQMYWQLAAPVEPRSGARAPEFASGNPLGAPARAEVDPRD